MMMDDETAHTCIKYKVIYSPCPVPLYQTNTTHIPQTLFSFLNSHLFLSWTVHLGCNIFKVKAHTFKYGPNPAFISFIFILFSFQKEIQFQFQQYKLKKHWWCACDSNPGPQNVRRRQNHWAVASDSTFYRWKHTIQILCFNMGQTWPLLFSFSSFSHYNDKYGTTDFKWKCTDGLLGIRTWDGWM